MHYYLFNIADYRKDTQHLTPMEHYIYRELIDWYYLDESPIPEKTQLVMRRLRLVSENNQCLLNVLDEFFFLTENGWEHRRINQEIEVYHRKGDTARANGIKGGRPKKPKKTQLVNLDNPDITQTKANHKPITNNHKPIKKKKEKEIFELPEFVNPMAWEEFEQHRRDIRKPLTELAKTKAANCLNGFSPEEQQAAVDQTIQNQWTGIFPKKLNGANYETDKNRQNTGNNGSGSGPGREEVDFNSMDW